MPLALESHLVWALTHLLQGPYCTMFLADYVPRSLKLKTLSQVTVFEQTEPYANYPGHDLNYISYAGLLTLFGV